MNTTISEILGKDACFRYQLLSRMKADCEYYLGCGNRCRKYLWADDEEEQIALMKALWRSFSEKPEWLTWDEILESPRICAGDTNGRGCSNIFIWQFMSGARDAVLTGSPIRL